MLTHNNIRFLIYSAAGVELGPTMVTARPGTNSEEGTSTIAKDDAAHTLVTASASNSYYELAVQPDLTSYATPGYARVRIRAPGAATANSKWYSVSDGTFRIGPLAAGETISCWVGSGEPATVTISYARMV